MCHHSFINFLCGCKRIEESECDYAREIDINFWRKIDCPHYTVEQLGTRAPCGAGGFYCGATDDGKVFDCIHARHKEVTQQATDAGVDVAQRKRLLLAKRDVWMASGKSLTAFTARRDVEIFAAGITESYHEKMRLEQESDSWSKVEMLAKHHYIDQRQRQQQGYAAAASFASFLKRFHPQVYARIDGAAESDRLCHNAQAETFHMMGKSTLPVTPQQLISSRPTAAPPLDPPSSHHAGGAPAMARSHARQASTDSSTRRCTRQKKEPVSIRDHTTNLPDPATLRAQDMAAQNAIPEVQAHLRKLQKRGSPKKQDIEPPSSPEKSSSRVRRSTRIKNKKVNYNVDEISDPSRSPSPNKSEASAFSPEKSDPSDTPSKLRGNVKKESSASHNNPFDRGKQSLLGDKIGEWQRRDHRIRSPHTPLEASATQMRGRKRTAEEESTPESRRTKAKQEPTQQQQAWLISTGDIDPRIGVLSRARNDSQVRNSFSQTAASFHAAPQLWSEPARTIDPTKRPATAPTPIHSLTKQERSMSGDQGQPFSLGISAAGSAMPNPLSTGLPNRGFTSHGAPLAQQQLTTADNLSAQSYDDGFQYGYAMPQEDYTHKGAMGGDTSLEGFELPIASGLRFDDNAYSDIDWSLLDVEALV